MTKIEKVMLVVALVLFPLTIWLILTAERDDAFQIKAVAVSSFCIAWYMLLKIIPTPEQQIQNMRNRTSDKQKTQDEPLSGENITIKNDPAVAAINFAPRTGDGLIFLRLWHSGEFDAIRRGWPDAPESVFIGADPLFVDLKPKSSGNCVASGTEEIWKSGDVIIVKKYNCADGSILKRETEK